LATQDTEKSSEYQKICVFFSQNNGKKIAQESKLGLALSLNGHYNGVKWSGVERFFTADPSKWRFIEGN